MALQILFLERLFRKSFLIWYSEHMSFQAYIDNIYSKTNKTPEDFKRLAEKAGLLKTGTKATQITDWLKKEHGLGLGHARAIYLLLKPCVGKDQK